MRTLILLGLVLAVTLCFVKADEPAKEVVLFQSSGLFKTPKFQTGVEAAKPVEISESRDSKVIKAARGKKAAKARKARALKARKAGIFLSRFFF